MIVDEGDADVVLVGFHRDFDYERMRVASTAVRRGARLVATNDDATYPTPDGLIPGAGSILAGIERASGVRAEVAGKPYPAMAAAVAARLDGTGGVVVGDRPDTDGRFAVAMGFRFALVLTVRGDRGGGRVGRPAAGRRRGGLGDARRSPPRGLVRGQWAPVPVVASRTVSATSTPNTNPPMCAMYATLLLGP